MVDDMMCNREGHDRLHRLVGKHIGAGRRDHARDGCDGKRCAEDKRASRGGRDGSGEQDE